MNRREFLETVADRVLQPTQPTKILGLDRRRRLDLNSDDTTMPVLDYDINLVLVLRPVVRKRETPVRPGCELQ